MNLRRQILLMACVLSVAHAGAAERTKDPVEGRFEKVRGFDFDKLPLQDAIKIVHGDGTRRIAVFSDPNCGHCKRVERDLKAIGNVSVFVFIHPVLGPDSSTKARNLWCSSERTRSWENWMGGGVEPANAAGQCDATALQRNMALGRSFQVEGTPLLIFNDGTRVPGAIPAAWIEKLLAASGRR